MNWLFFITTFVEIFIKLFPTIKKITDWIRDEGWTKDDKRQATAALRKFEKDGNLDDLRESIRKIGNP